MKNENILDVTLPKSCLLNGQYVSEEIDLKPDEIETVGEDDRFIYKKMRFGRLTVRYTEDKMQ